MLMAEFIQTKIVVVVVEICDTTGVERSANMCSLYGPIPNLSYNWFQLSLNFAFFHRPINCGVNIDLIDRSAGFVVSQCNIEKYEYTIYHHAKGIFI